MADEIEKPLQLTGAAPELARFSDMSTLYWVTRKDSPTQLIVYNLWGHDWNNRRVQAAEAGVVTTDLSQGLEMVKRASTYI